MFQVTELWIYPIKSCKGIALSKVELDEKGFKYDRRFVVTDANYNVVTQREHNSMALIAADIDGNVLKLGTVGMPDLEVSLQFDESQMATVKIWKDNSMALKVSVEADFWFTKFLGFKCYLMYMPDNSKRMVDPKYSKHGATITFTDDFPISLISQASLDNLNDRMEQTLPMNRFRPNIVVSGTNAFAEDSWKRIKIGDVEFDVVKPSARCIMTTINQETGVCGSMEPLKTLSKYRTEENKILFGQNIIHLQKGQIVKGDTIQIRY